MDAKTPIIAATAAATSSHLVRGERLSFDCSVMKACSGSEERRPTPVLDVGRAAAGEAGHKVLNRPSGHSANLNWLEFGTYPNHQRSPLLMMATGMNVAASRSVSSLRPSGKMIGSTNRADHGT